MTEVEKENGVPSYGVEPDNSLEVIVDGSAGSSRIRSCK